MDLFIFIFGAFALLISFVYLLFALIKRRFKKELYFGLLVGGIVLSITGLFMDSGEKNKEKTIAELPKTNDVSVSANTTKSDNVKLDPKKADYKSEAKSNAEKYPAMPGSVLYDKSGSKFKGMQYYFKGHLIKLEKVEGLFGKMEKALLVKNDQGYIMPIFPPYEIETSIGDEIEVWGPLSGDGYSSSDLGIENVVGVTGALNATQLNVNGVPK